MPDPAEMSVSSPHSDLLQIPLTDLEDILGSTADELQSGEESVGQLGADQQSAHFDFGDFGNYGGFGGGFGDGSGGGASAATRQQQQQQQPCMPTSSVALRHLDTYESGTSAYPNPDRVRSDPVDRSLRFPDTQSLRHLPDVPILKLYPLDKPGPSRAADAAAAANPGSFGYFETSARSISEAKAGV